MEFTEGVRFDSLNLSPEMMRAVAQRNIEVGAWGRPSGPAGH